MTPTKQSREAWWSLPDLFFLQDALNRGMTCAEVAGFLSREEDEVRKKAKQMKTSAGRWRPAVPHRL